MADPKQGAGLRLGVDRPRRAPRTIDAETRELPRSGRDAIAIAPDAARSRFAEAVDANAAVRREPPQRAGVARAVPARLGTAALIIAVATVTAAAPSIVSAWRGDSDTTSGRIAAIEAQQQDAAIAASVQAAKSDELSRRMTKLAAQAAASSQPAADATLGARLAALEVRVKPLTDRIDDLDRRLRNAEGRAASPVERGISAGAEATDPRTAATALARDEHAIAALADRLNALETAVKSTPGQAASSAEPGADSRLRRAVVAVVLRRAVERGYPYGTELATARTIGLDPVTLAALAPFADAGVPTQIEVFRELSTLVPALLRASGAAAPNAAPGNSANRAGNYWERLQGGAERLVHIRPVGDAQDDDPQTTIGRIELAMTHRDVAAVSAELDKLPPAAMMLGEAWRKKALGREAAITAARGMASTLLSELVDDAPAPIAGPR